MIRMTAAAVLVAALTLQASAQQVMDGSDKGLPAHDLKSSIDLLARQFTDPYALQIRGLRAVRAGYCGEFNSKNDRGGYIGFAPFYVSAREDYVRIVPAIPIIRAERAAEVATLCR